MTMSVSTFDISHSTFGFMSLNFKIEKFEGPLDLLLRLIEEEKLSISEISLSAVTDQFLESLKDVAEKDPDELADFLVVAARLLLLKSRELLPTNEPLEEDGPSLEFQLKMYKIFWEASQKLAARIKQKRFLHFRDKLPAAIAPRFAPPPSATAERLHQVFLDVLAKITPVIKYPEERMKKVISIQEKIDHIRAQLAGKKNLSFKELLKDSADKTEVVVNFLAILELVRSRQITVDQEEEFGEITIRHKSE
jgi:segregation and condensation protein A